ncbi:unnamed protein product [Calypogeia fissa]
MEIGTEHGKKYLFELTDAALATEEDSDEVSSDVDERSSQRHNTSFVADSVGGNTAGRRRWSTTEEEQHQQDEEQHEEEEG